GVLGLGVAAVRPAVRARALQSNVTPTEDLARVACESDRVPDRLGGNPSDGGERDRTQSANRLDGYVEAQDRHLIRTPEREVHVREQGRHLIRQVEQMVLAVRRLRGDVHLEVVDE